MLAPTPWSGDLDPDLDGSILLVITILGLQICGLLSGAFIIESVFASPGLGM